MTELSVMVTDNHWAAVADIETVCATTLQAAATALPKPVTGSVSILLTNNDEIADLNERMRGKSGPTNVLSFPAGPALPGMPTDEAAVIGDIALAFETCEREAAEIDISIKDHISHLVVHGILHLFGYDHIDDDEAEIMEALEVQILADMGIKDPYAGTERLNG